MVRIHGVFLRLLAPAAISFSCALAVAVPTAGYAQPGARGRVEAATPGEVRAQKTLDAAKRFGAPGVYAFLKSFPKGADLHMHLSGAVYAETFIAEAVKQGLCVMPVPAVSPNDPPGTPPSPVGQNAVRFVAPGAAGCPDKSVPASSVLTNQPLYDNLVDSFSMRAYVPTQGNGHDQFFATFSRYGGLKDVAGQWLDEVATRAAAQNEQYLEIMQTPTFSNAAKLGAQIGWPAGSEKEVSHATLAALRDKLIAAGLRSEIAVDRKELADAKAHSVFSECQQILYGNNRATESKPGCGVQIHWLYQVLRGNAPQQVFAQTLLGFEVASADPDIVGINFVQPEDGRLSMQDYHLQMEMLDYLHSVYPQVHISLHAGELAPGLVPMEGLRFHIREAVELGHAERIGHGVDLMYENDPAGLLKEMAAKYVDVEVNLTSNDVILGVKGTDHPVAAYMAARVPVSLSTDDEGVSRIDLTHEYVRAVEEQGFTYRDLKQAARASLEHSFLHGESLFAAPDDFHRERTDCSGAIAATSNPSPACQKFLESNEKAAAQWELERRLAGFEQNAAGPLARNSVITK